MNKNHYYVDIHGLNEDDGYCKLLETLNALPQGAQKLTVVHGYHGGKVLQTMVRSFVHYRIENIVAPFGNDGETVIYLKQ